MLLAWLPALAGPGRADVHPARDDLARSTWRSSWRSCFRWDRRPWLAFGLPVVQVCWVNTQGLFLFEPILIGFALSTPRPGPGPSTEARRGWWRTVLAAIGLDRPGLPAQPLWPGRGPLSDPARRDDEQPDLQEPIGELKPLPTFIEEVGLDSLPAPAPPRDDGPGRPELPPAPGSGAAGSALADRRAGSTRPRTVPGPARPRDVQGPEEGRSRAAEIPDRLAAAACSGSCCSRPSAP